MFARSLRKNMTEAESKLWSRIRGKVLGGFRFRRQHPIGKYVVDFACLSEQIIFEIDGATHSNEEDIIRDEHRTQFLNTQGWRVIRYGNEEVFKHMDDVLDDIYAHLKGLKQ